MQAAGRGLRACHTRPLLSCPGASFVGQSWGCRGAQEVRRALMIAWGGMSALTALMCLHSRPCLRLLNLKSGQEQLHFESGRRLTK